MGRIILIFAAVLYTVAIKSSSGSATFIQICDKTSALLMAYVSYVILTVVNGELPDTTNTVVSAQASAQTL